MVGLAESYFVAFAISVGMSASLAGIFGTLPLFLGAVFHLITPWGISRVSSVKRWVSGFALIQALSFLPLIYASLYGIENPLWLFVPVTLYWTAGYAANPPWYFWMGFLLKSKDSSDYFSTRGRIAQAGTFSGLIIGGLILQSEFFRGAGLSYFLIFLLAGLARSFSSYTLSKKDFLVEWKFKATESITSHFKSFTQNRDQKDFFQFLFFFMFAIFVSSPFVVPFFLKIANFSYGQLTVTIGALFVGKIIGLQIATIVRERLGLKALFFIGAFGIAPLPALWYFSYDFYYSVTLQALSGFFWAFFEVSLSLVFFEKITEQYKIFRLTLYNFLNATAIVLGSFLGGYLLKSYEETLTGYKLIFVFGSFLRLSLVILYFQRSKFSTNFR